MPGQMFCVTTLCFTEGLQEESKNISHGALEKRLRQVYSNSYPTLLGAKTPSFSLTGKQQICFYVDLAVFL